MERQVNDMLAFARMGRLAMEKISVAGFVRRLVEAFDPTLEGRDINLIVRNWVEVDAFYGNPDALHGILLNLLNNAVEALDGAGEIRLELGHPAPGWLRLVVSDNGPGIAEDIRARIFEPFFTTRTNGTGLGLAIVECVVRAHGGRVSCQSSEGQGASFLLDFPLATPAPLPGGFCGKNHSLGG
jgi:two-component system sensor histidine kinase FlrB